MLKLSLRAAGWLSAAMLFILSGTLLASAPLAPTFAHGGLSIIGAAACFVAAWVPARLT